MSQYKNKNIDSLTSICNTDEHKEWNRRSFLQALGISSIGTLSMGGISLAAAEPSRLMKSIALANSGDRVLLIVRLVGGNDGLNTIIPRYDYDFYAQARPTIRIKENEMVALNANFGVPSSAQRLSTLWKEGQMRVVHNVGYNNASLSHFDGTDNWAIAQENRGTDSGWLGRYFEQKYDDYFNNPPASPAAVQVGNNGNLAFKVENRNYSFAIPDTRLLEQIAQEGYVYRTQGLPGGTFGQKAKYLREIANNTFRYSDTIKRAYDNSTTYPNYPSGKFTDQLRVISKLIKGNLGTKVYMVNIGSFDTHENQVPRHKALMEELSLGLYHFYMDLKSKGMDKNVLTMTISEFGRRIKQNGSGTDHGAAAPVMLFGKGLNGSGFVGTRPDLRDPDKNGNLKYSTNFLSVYSTILKKWLCVAPQIADEVLGKHPLLQLGFDCSSGAKTDKTQIEEASSFRHQVVQREDRVVLHIYSPRTRHTSIYLYETSGRLIGKAYESMVLEGDHNFTLNERYQLSTGHYIYRIVTSEEEYGGHFSIH